MIPVCFAWGPGQIVRLAHDDRVVWAMAFEMLPGATMKNAQCVEHGMVCVPAIPEETGAETLWRFEPSSKLEVYAVNLSQAETLQPYVDQIIAAFRDHMEALMEQAA